MKKTLLMVVSAGIGISCSPTKTESDKVEHHRPQIHFSPPSGWMNDPNGLVHYKGDYHLFYQHYPDSTVWGPMHWGHAVSKNLIHWEHQPIALYPDSSGLIFSGSAVVDAANSAGLKTATKDAIISIFTYDKQGFETQAIAYSIDNGKSWTKYVNNPVIKNPGEKDFRDPKVFWHEQTQCWIMSLAVYNRIQFYTSKNLKEWELSGEFGQEHGSHLGVWECPDLFSLNIDQTDEIKWVLLVSVNRGSPNGGSGTQYFVGDFDGKTFTNANNPKTELWIDYGRDNYAGVTWSNLPDNRTIFLGWMSNWDYAQIVPTEKWRSAMTLPRELTLRSTSLGPRLASRPVAELENIRGPGKSFGVSKVQEYNHAAELKFEIDLGQSTSNDFGVEFYNSKNERLRVGYDRTSNRYYADRTHSGNTNFSEGFAGIHYAPRVSDSPVLSFHLVVDVASVELFADGGTSCITTIYFPSEDFNHVRIFAQNGEIKLQSGEMHELTSIWKR